MKALSNILLLHKDHPEPQATGEKLVNWLASRGIQAKLRPAGTPREELRPLAAASDAVIILGGDGTVIGVARALAGILVPLAGMNFGRVGFLAPLPPKDWEQPMEELIQGKWREETHLVLKWSILRRDGDFFQTVHEGIAINDVVTAHGIVARSVSISLSIDGFPFSRVQGDGVIVSTSLGSTAYTAWAGGPLTIPSLNAQLITPVCPFAGSFPPLVLPASANIRLEACRKRDQVIISVDGQEDYPLEHGDILEIRGDPGRLSLLVKERGWYLKRLIDCGIVRQGPGKRDNDICQF